MIPLRDFESYLEDGTVRKITPDINRAKYLREEAGKRFLFITKLIKNQGITDDNANYVIENCYNVLSELLRAKMLEKGYASSGQGSHESEVAFMRTLSLPEPEISLMNELRYYRNGIQYYGKILEKDYAEKVDRFMRHLLPKLDK